MKLDYQRLIPYIKANYPEKFSQLGSLDSFSVSDLEQTIKNVFTEKELVQAVSYMLDIPYIELAASEITQAVYQLLPEVTKQRYRLVPFKEEGGVVYIAMSDPTNYNAMQAISFLFRNKDENYKIFITDSESIQRVMDSFHNISAEVQSSLSEIATEKAQSDNIVVDEDIIQLDQKVNQGDNDIDSAPVIKIVSVILKNAIEGGASDIHIEGIGNEVRVRFRVDGVLHQSLILPKNIFSAVVARIKILSKLKIDEQRKPQDGRFSIMNGSVKIDFRVSTFPTQFGEKVVLRILDTSKGIMSLESLGFKGPRAEVIEESIRKPYGMVLVTGPTGSGKSTTLYTLLSMVNNDDINIVTLEDPVEYFVEGINQSQVRPEINYTFASGLRSILRQDPDIIMVGEIRDSETAGMAVQAALTGHLVFSTLHTNDSIGSIPRLQDMGVETFLISASLELIIAQRLVRKLCTKCKNLVSISASVQKYFDTELNQIPVEIQSKLLENIPQPGYIFEPVGCEYCQDGYKGRLSIFESLPITEEVKAMIDNGDQEDQILEFLRTKGFMTMKQDGLYKVLAGDTSLKELLTVVEQ